MLHELFTKITNNNKLVITTIPHAPVFLILCSNELQNKVTKYSTGDWSMEATPRLKASAPNETEFSTNQIHTPFWLRFVAA